MRASYWCTLAGLSQIRVSIQQVCETQKSIHLILKLNFTLSLAYALTFRCAHAESVSLCVRVSGSRCVAWTSGRRSSRISLTSVTLCVTASSVGDSDTGRGSISGPEVVGKGVPRGVVICARGSKGCCVCGPAGCKGRRDARGEPAGPPPMSADIAQGRHGQPRTRRESALRRGSASTPRRPLRAARSRA